MLGDRQRFAASVEWIGKNLRFDIVSSQFINLSKQNQAPTIFLIFDFIFLISFIQMLFDLFADGCLFYAGLVAE